jgi:predicted unusual protein kinase regulating ubiquinone biosynthesis (AarF/ABC1/UbiB family)
VIKTLRRYYNPFRVYAVFRVILTVFMIIKGKKSFFFIKPLRPEKLIKKINGLGASFIKLAQVLATRADFFTDEYLYYLRQLHDEIPPMSEKDFKKVFKRAFKDKVCFKEFEDEPIASASIGQVHRAILMDGREVAVKLRRFDIQNVIRADIKILNFFNGIFRPLFSENTKNSLDAVIAEFSKMIVKEVDLTIELSNLKKFSETYKNSGVSFPEGFSECSSSDALVMSFIHGYRFDDKEHLKKLNISFEDVMKKLIYFYVDQMFIKGFFHADPHPGNLMLTEEGELILLDFGMVQKIPSRTRQAIIQLTKAAHERNFEMYIRYAKRLGVISQDAPEFDLQDIAERIFDILDDASLDSKSMQSLAFELLESMKNIPYKLPQEAIYIMRVSSIVEGLGTNYIPNFNGIKDILPVLKDKLPQALGFDIGFIETAKKETIELPLTLKKIKKIIDEMADFSLEVKLSPEDIERLKLSVFKHVRPFMAGVLLIVTAFFVQRMDIPYDRAISATLYTLGLLRIIFTL